MFCISYTQQKQQKKDLRVIINFKISNESNNIVEFQTCLENACSISNLIQEKNSKNTFSQDINLDKDEYFDKDLFIKLSTLIFNNEPIIYSKENIQTLQKISEIFQIQKLKSSIERFNKYFDNLNQFSHGRLPIIDIEFLCQLYLLDLNEDNNEDTQNASYRFINEITSDTFCQILYRCIFCRLSKTNLYLDFIVNKMKDLTTKFIQILMKNYRFYSFVSISEDFNLQVVCYLLRYFIENNFLRRADEESFNYQKGWRSYTYQFFDFDDGNIHYDATYYVYRNYDELTKDNYSLHRKLVLNGKNQNPLFQIIEKDDLESLQNLIAYDPSFDIDANIDSCYYESRPLFQYYSLSLLEIAAYFQSIRIFKFLIVNNAMIRKKELQQTSLYGGNSEIIRICQQKGIEYKIKYNYDNESPFKIVIKMHYFDLLRWLFEKEEENEFIDLNFVELIGYSLRCSNFVAFYYLIGHYMSNDEDSDIHFTNYTNDLILSYNIPVLKNYLDMKNENLQNLSSSFQEYNKHFLDILLINNDTELIDIFLENNRIDDLKSIPYENISSLTYQKMGRFLITHKNVTCSSDLLADLIEDLLRDDLKNDENDFKTDKINNVAVHNQIKSPEFINQQVQFLYENALSLEDKILLLPVIFKYNLFENNYDNKYKEILESDDTSIKFKLIDKKRQIFRGFIQYTNPSIFEFVLKRMTSKSKKNYGKSNYIIGDSLKSNNYEIFQYLITSEFSPFSKRFKFNGESFFNVFYEINSIETLKKVIQLFNENCKEYDFYKDVFLPEVLYHSADSCKEINEYLLNLPDIEPFINAENSIYSNLPPILYLCNFFISADYFVPFIDNEKVDINIRDSENHYNLICRTSNYELLLLLLKSERMKWTPEDAVVCMEKGRYPGNKDIFELFLNGLLYENDGIHKNPLNLKINFTNDQLSRIFNKLCITDDRIEIAQKFYSKFSHCIDVNYKKDGDDSFCLLDAIDCQCDKMVKFLLEISELDLNRRASTGSVNSHFDYTNNITPFCYAVVCNNDEIIRLFFKRKADFDINETFSDKIFSFSFFFNEITCLHYAAMRDNPILIKKLLNFPNIDKHKLNAVHFYYYFMMILTYFFF